MLLDILDMQVGIESSQALGNELLLPIMPLLIYNQAILTEATEGTEAAVELMEALWRTTNDSMAGNALNQMQQRIASSQMAAAQLAQ